MTPERAGTYARRLPLARDRDRIAAAILAAERLRDQIQRRQAVGWATHMVSDGTVVSQRLSR